MAKRKWYVVTVGKDIGVFTTWLEAGALVKGVPEALHQSFTSEEEARHCFALAQARGETRIVDGNTSPRTPTRRGNEGRNSHNSGTSLSSMRLPMDDNFSSQSASHHGLSRPSRTPTSVHVSASQAPVQLSSPALSRSSSEPSSRFRHLEVIESVFQKNHDTVNTGTKTHASLGSATSSPLVPSSAMREGHSQVSNVVVKTPTWLTSYPRRPKYSDSQPLSPLNSADLPLNTFIPESLVQDMKRTPGFSNDHAKSPSGHLSSVGDSSIYLQSPQSDLLGPETAYGHDVDPRSPIFHKNQVPELAFANVLVFSRPSPSIKSDKLPVRYGQDWSAPQTSLLFESSS